MENEYLTLNVHMENVVSEKQAIQNDLKLSESISEMENFLLYPKKDLKLDEKDELSRMHDEILSEQSNKSNGYFIFFSIFLENSGETPKVASARKRGRPSLGGLSHKKIPNTKTPLNSTKADGKKLSEIPHGKKLSSVFFFSY